MTQYDLVLPMSTAVHKCELSIAIDLVGSIAAVTAIPAINLKNALRCIPSTFRGVTHGI